MTLGGPGIPVQVYIHETPDYRVFDLGHYYKYEIHGYYGRTDADQVCGTYVDCKGYMRKITSGKQGCLVKGWVHAAITLNCWRYPRKMNFQSNKVHTSTGDKVFSGPVLRQVNKNISVGFYMNGNTKDPDGYMVIFGAAMKSPPKPTGKLTIDNYIYRGNQAQIEYTINKDVSEELYEYDWDPSSWQESLPEVNE